MPKEYPNWEDICKADTYTSTPRITIRNDDITTVPPTSGDHYAGEILKDSSGNLWLCEVSGNPGTWSRLGKIKNPYDWFKSENPDYMEITGLYTPGQYPYGSPSGYNITSYIPETQKDKNNNDIPVLTNFVSSGYNASNPSGLMAIAYHGTTQGYFNYPSKLITHCKFLAVYHNNIRDLTMVFSLAKIQNVGANKVIYSDATAPAQNVGIYKDGQKHYLFWRDGSNFGSINVTRYYDDANNKSESKDVWLYLDGLNLYYMIDEFDYTKFSLLHTFSTSFYISPQYLANSIATGSLGCRIDYVISKLIFSR